MSPKTQLPTSAFKAVSGGTGTLLVLHIQPGAKRTAVAGAFGDTVKVAVSSPPVDGKANAQLLGFLSELLGLPKSALQLVSGASGRYKMVSISGLTPDAVRQKLESGR